jgi:hypothetical protein
VSRQQKRNGHDVSVLHGRIKVTWAWLEVSAKVSLAVVGRFALKRKKVLKCLLNSTVSLVSLCAARLQLVYRGISAA